MGEAASAEADLEQTRQADQRLRALEAVKRNGFSFANLDDRFRADKEIVLEAVSQYWPALRYASPEVRADKEVVFEAVKKHGLALEHASDALQANQEVVLAAVAQDWLAFQVADKSLRAEKNFVLEVVGKNGCALRYASDALKADEDVVIAAVRQCGRALEFAHEDFRADREFMLKAVQLQGEALQHAAPALKADREIVTTAVKQYGPSWKFAAGELRKDKDILLLGARNLNQDSDYIFLDEKQDIVGQGVAEKVIDAAVAVRGEDAPIISVNSMTLQSPPESSSKDGSQFAEVFCCEVSLLSGASFVCDVADCFTTTNQGGSERQCPTLNDLATKIVGELPKHAQVRAQRVFINFAAKEDGEAISVSPWGWSRPLTAFLRS